MGVRRKPSRGISCSINSRQPWGGKGRERRKKRDRIGWLEMRKGKEQYCKEGLHVLHFAILFQES